MHVVDESEGVTTRIDVTRSRAECTACHVSFTVYESGHYPHRQYQLDVVANVVAAVAIGGRSAAQAAAEATTSATSARRWTAWIAALAAPARLCAATLAIDPDAPAGVGWSAAALTSGLRARAARLLAALEELGAALVRRGVDLVSRSGLGRVLEWQRRAHGDVVHLVGQPNYLSPAMALGMPVSGP